MLDCCNIIVELHALHGVTAALWSSTQGWTPSNAWGKEATWGLALIGGNHTDVILLEWCGSHVLGSLYCQPCTADKGLQAFTANYNLLIKAYVLPAHSIQVIPQLAADPPINLLHAPQCMCHIYI